MLSDLEATREADWATVPPGSENERENPKVPLPGEDEGLLATTRTAPTSDRLKLFETREPKSTVRRKIRDSRTSAAQEDKEVTAPARMGRLRRPDACGMGLPIATPVCLAKTMRLLRMRGCTPRRPMTTAAAVRVACPTVIPTDLIVGQLFTSVRLWASRLRRWFHRGRSCLALCRCCIREPEAPFSPVAC